MRRLLANLMQNAVHYAGVELEITTRMNGDKIELRVLDRGPGVAPDQIEALLQPFTRGDAARTGKPGAGLGLAIVERIARLHGGSFELQLRAGGGLAANVVIPLQPR